MRFQPHPYQRYCVERVISDEALGLFLDMGLGKTVITLTAFNDLKFNRYQVSKALVIAPKKVAEATWSREAAKWDHLKHIRVIPILGSPQRRIRALNTSGDVYVINRENVPWLVEYCRNAWPFDMVIVDEFSSFKNSRAKRTKALNLVRPRFKRFVGLTGTPAANGLLDLWSLMYLLDRGQRLGRTLASYKEQYFDPGQQGRDASGLQRVFTYVPREGAEAIIWQRLQDICISLSADDYLDLPDITDHTIPVKLDNQAQKAYDRLERTMVLEIAEQERIAVGSAASLTNKLLQLCNGAVYDEERGVHEIHKCKIEAFVELLEALQGQPVLVFYSFQHDLVRIHEALQDTGLRVRELRTPADEEAWNRREVDVLLAHPASAAYGLNLQDGGNHVIWFSPNWSLELYQQANKRLHRQGQHEKVIVHHLAVVGGMDEEVLASLEAKGDTQTRLLNALKARIDKWKGEGDGE